MTKSILTIGLYFFMTFLHSQAVITDPFNKEKWDSSAKYRYDLILRSDSIFTTRTMGKRQAEVINILGNPVRREVIKNTPVLLKQGWTLVDKSTNLTYCLDITDQANKNQNNNKCLGSYIILHFYQDSLVDMTIAIVD